jgi:hypothetical protein
LDILTKDEALKRLYEITDGIDRDEAGGGAGWWETIAGAEFGLERLHLLEDLISGPIDSDS